MKQNWLIHDGTECYGAVLGGTWWYWVIKGQYWAVLGFILESLIV